MSQLTTTNPSQGESLPAQGPGAPLGISNLGWFKIGTLVALAAALFWPNLHRLWAKTNPFYGDPNWGHGMAVPLLSLYYLYVNRESLRNPPTCNLSSRQRVLLLGGLMALTLSMLLLWVKTFTHLPMVRAEIAVLAAIVAIFAVLWLSREGPAVRWFGDASASWFGSYILLYGVVLYAYGIYPGQNDFLKDMGMVTTVMGMAIVLGGWARMSVLWFAAAFLVCAIPWPDQYYSQLAMPLQQLAANVAVWTLSVTGVDSFSSGTKIFINGYGGSVRTLNVAQACAGLRSLMTFVTLGGAVGFLSGRPLWQKCLVTVSAVPIAVLCNVVRVSGQGLLDHYVSQQLSESFAHQFVGLIMFIPAILLILLVAWGLDQIFVEEADRRHQVAGVLRQKTVVAALPAGLAGGPLLSRSRPAPRAVASPAKPAPRPGPATVAPPPPSARLAARRAPVAKNVAKAPVTPSAAAPRNVKPAPKPNNNRGGAA